MSEASTAFKHLLSAAIVKELAAELRAAWPQFPAARFTREATAGLDALELKARGAHIGQALGRALPTDLSRAFQIAIASLGPPLEVTEGYGSTVFRYLPLSSWLHEVGPRDVEGALRANYELTKRFSAEFSIRALLLAAQERTLKELRRWAKDDDAHVRRLVSEGTRPRLPWAERLPALQRDPSLTLPLLELLKDDETEYVRRSVANHLNDLSKDHPNVVLEVAGRWLKGASRERRRLVEHGLRTLVKKGDGEALRLLGASGAALRISGTVGPARLRVGEHVTVEATVENTGRQPTHVVVEAVIFFVKPRGVSKKAFRLSRFDLAPHEQVTVSRRFAMEHRSIRRLSAGVHRVDVQANGKVVPAGAFDLRLT